MRGLLVVIVGLSCKDFFVGIVAAVVVVGVVVTGLFLVGVSRGSSSVDTSLSFPLQ